MNWDMLLNDPKALARALRQMEQDIARLEKSNNFPYLEVGSGIAPNAGDVAISGNLTVGGYVALVRNLALSGRMVGWDGWWVESLPWYKQSTSQFALDGDVRYRYPVGTKLEWYTEGANLSHGYVGSSTYSAPYTYVNIIGELIGGTAALTQQKYSYSGHPQGFPDLFNFAPLLYQNGANIALASAWGKFKISGKSLEFWFMVQASAAGTTNTQIEIRGMPVANNLSSSAQPVGEFVYIDQGTAFYVGAITNSAATYLNFIVHNAGNFLGFVPNFAVANTDYLGGHGAYPIA